MKNCEKCNKLHDGAYATGRFCSRKCANTRLPTTETKDKIRKSIIKNGKTGKFNQEIQSKGNAVRLENIQLHIRDDPFETLKSFSHKRQRILIEQNQKCEICNGEQIHNGKPLTFQMDHVNGDRSDNSRKNLRMICPNCHTQTPNWGSKNVSAESRSKMGIVLNENGERIYFGRSFSKPA